jgi:hypothetical protein
VNGSPDSEFAKILELLNAFERLEQDEQRSLLESSVSAKRPLLAHDSPSAEDAGEAKTDNRFAAHIVSAMAKRYP